MQSHNSGTATYRWVILGVTFLAQAAAGAAPAIFVLAVFYQVDLHLDKTQVGLLSSALGLGVMISLLLSGWITDRLSIRRLLVFGLCFSALTLGLTALTTSFSGGMLFFLMAGLAAGIAVPATMKAIVVWFPSEERGSAMGLMRTGVPILGAVAAATLPSLSLHLGWRAGIVALAGVVGLAGLVAFALYREPLVPLQAKAGARSSPLELLRNPNILLVSTVAATLTAAQFTLANYLLLYLTETLYVPVVAAGRAMAALQVSGAIGRVAWGAISDRAFAVQRKRVLMLIVLASAILLVIVGFLPGTMSLWMVVLVAIGLGALVLGWQAIFSVLLPELSGRDLAASAVGLGHAWVQIGVVAGPPLFGRIVDVSGSYRWAWSLLGLLVATGAPLLLLVKEGRNGDGRDSKNS